MRAKPWSRAIVSAALRSRSRVSAFFSARVCLTGTCAIRLLDERNDTAQYSNTGRYVKGRALMAVLEVRGLTKQYRRGPLVNDDISLEVRAGEVFGLLGPNGAGRTPLIGQIIGLVGATAGSITIDGVRVVADPA